MATTSPSRTAACALCDDLKYIVERGPLWTLALNLNQSLPGRCVLVLNRHAEDVRELAVEEWSDLHRQIARATAALDTLFDPDLYNYAFLMNQDAHIHLHVVPRYSSPREWRGERFVDPHFGSLFGTEQRHLPREALEALRDAIRERLPDP
jgi:diadenosine tetraphosphate (Ap4A) HIT family hydrolase